MDKKRVDWVDIFKGIVIILMVIGHSTSPWVGWIYLFHMPAFIFSSGYTVNIKKYNIIDFIKRKFISLFIPFMSINILYILLMGLLDYLNIYKFLYDTEFNFVNSMVNLLTKLNTIDFGGATWFLVVLFLIEIIFKILHVFSKDNDKNLIIMVFITFFVSLILQKYKMYLGYNLDLALYGIIYYYMGYIISKFDILQNGIDKKLMIPIAFLMMIFLSKYFKVHMNWPTRDFEVFYINIIGAFSGIYLTFIISRLLEKNEILKSIFKNIGKKTYVILILHFAVFRMIFFLLYKFNFVDQEYLKQLVPLSGNKFWFLLSLITVIICYIIGKISEKNKITNYIFNAKVY